MRDHRYVPEDGPPQLVSEMSTATIEELLRDGAVEIVHDDGTNTRVPDVMDRLRLELEIRALGLSSRRVE